MAGDVSDVRIEASPLGPIVSPMNPANPVRPARPSTPVVLYLHGDLRLSGDLEPALHMAGELALRTGSTVICTGYRPTFHDALEDVRAAYRFSRASGPVAVVGERAGAGLAAALLTSLRDEGAEPPRCAVLLSGLLDLTLKAPSLLLNSCADRGFDLAEFRRRAEHYAAGAAPDDPLVSPLFANLHGLPPLQLLAAGTDPLVDDTLAFAARAARSGVTVDLRVRPDGAALQDDAVAAMSAFIEACRPDTHAEARADAPAADHWFLSRSFIPSSRTSTG